MNVAAIDLTRRYSYEEYLSWNEIRCELIDGFVKFMSGVTATHTRVGRKIIVALSTLMEKRPKEEWEVFYAPFDVILPEPKNSEDKPTIVQPDILVVRDSAKIHENACYGAPDLVIEILSPYSLKRDISDKLGLYERNAIPEYWVVQPKEKTVTVFALRENLKYDEGRVYSNDDRLFSLIPGIEVHVNNFF